MELEKTKEIAIKTLENNVNQETALNLKNTFMPFFEHAEAWAKKAKNIKVTDSTQLDVMKNARDIRLNIRSIRINTEKTRVELKAESLRKGKAIDGIANVIKFLIVPIEEHLQMQEDFLIIQFEKRKAELKETREKELEKYDVLDTSFYNLAEMPDANYTQLLENSKANFQLKKDAERKAEEKRIEQETMEAEERERDRKENEKLKKEATERDRLAEIERKEQEKTLGAERKKNRELEAEIRAKAGDAEIAQKEAVAKAEAEKKALDEKQLAPDKEKLLEFADSLVRVEIPDLESKKANDILQTVTDYLLELRTYIKQECQKL
jgi:hypothetical protein